MPGSFDVAFHPFLDMGDIFLGVLEILMDVLTMAVEEVGVGLLTGCQGGGPGAVLDTCGEVAWLRVGIGGGEVHVHGSGLGVECVERVLFFVR